MMPGPNWQTRWRRWQEQHLSSSPPSPPLPSPSFLPSTQPRSILDEPSIYPDNTARPPPSYEESYRDETQSEATLDATETDGENDGFVYSDVSQSIAAAAIHHDERQPSSHPPKPSSSHFSHPYPSIPMSSDDKPWAPSQISLSPPLQTSTPLASRHPILRRPQSTVQSAASYYPEQDGKQHTYFDSGRGMSSKPAPLPRRPPSTPIHLHTPTPLRPSHPIAFLQQQPPSHHLLTRQELQQRVQPIHAQRPRLASASSQIQLPPILPPSGPKLPKQISQSRALIEAELEREDEERARQKEDEARADHFYELGLVGRCWDVWTRGREWVLASIASVVSSHRCLAGQGVSSVVTLMEADRILPRSTTLLPFNRQPRFKSTALDPACFLIHLSLTGDELTHTTCP